MTGAALRALRSRMGLSQAALAKMLNTTRHRVSDWERGERPVPRYVQAHATTLEALHECEERERRS